MDDNKCFSELGSYKSKSKELNKLADTINMLKLLYDGLNEGSTILPIDGEKWITPLFGFSPSNEICLSKDGIRIDVCIKLK